MQILKPLVVNKDIRLKITSNRLNKVCVSYILTKSTDPLHSNNQSTELKAMSINFQSHLLTSSHTRGTDTCSNWMLPVHIKNSLTIDYFREKYPLYIIVHKSLL